VRRSTRELEEGSVWPEEVHGGRNRGRTAAAVALKRRRGARLRRPRLDSFSGDAQGDMADLLVASAERGVVGIDGATARQGR
jgi:hypothetical protein